MKKDKKDILLNMKLENSVLKNSVIQNAKRNIFTAYMQLKLSHEFFKFYLRNLSSYNTHKCNISCNTIQSSEHLMLYCTHYK